MRQVLSLSLPQKTTNDIKRNAKIRGFDTVSGYVKYLFELDKNLISEKELINSIKEARKEYNQSKTIKAKSLASLV